MNIMLFSKYDDWCNNEETLPKYFSKCLLVFKGKILLFEKYINISLY